jgi:hypothetical protein
MRTSLLVGLGVVALCAGCNRTPENPWPESPQTHSNVQATNNLKQHGLAVNEERFGPPEGDKKPRKLVYHADVDLVVEEMTAAELALARLLKAHDGVVANAESVSRAGAPRTGVRRLRIPAAKFDDFLKGLGELGEVQRSKLDVQDVTRSYSELEEQLRDLTAEVAGLRDLLKKPTDKLADTLAVREHLSKVTREMAALKGRLERMRARAELSTVTLRLLERSGSGAGSPSLGTSASRTLSDSWDALLGCGRSALLLGVLLVPWLPLLAVAAVPLWIWRRRRRAAASA